MGVSLYVICYFSLVALNILSVFNLCKFDQCVSWCVPPCIYPAWDSELPGLGWLFTFPCLGSFQLLPLQIFSQVLSSPSGTPLMRMLVRLMSSQGSLRLSSFLFILFSIFSSVAVISIILSSRSFIHASASVILLWIPSRVLFISACS